MTRDKDDLGAARGVVWGSLLSLPFWAVLAWLYWWIR